MSLRSEGQLFALIGLAKESLEWIAACTIEDDLICELYDHNIKLICRYLNNSNVEREIKPVIGRLLMEEIDIDEAGKIIEKLEVTDYE
ncbi:hypothetical protein JMM81_20755 [Bacillus sp. V3B]|uniref:hypothetical protein n=1 Tax=Bacillus sp. V3B TaxID=2804915 RepID=UPI0021090CCF|nr:hypothetical protein [Bacillus sp. V3B]MCQ6277307.1 hypothetical protein [Bacillus sp. V3B]